MHIDFIVIITLQDKSHQNLEFTLTLIR